MRRWYDYHIRAIRHLLRRRQFSIALHYRTSLRNVILSSVTSNSPILVSSVILKSHRYRPNARNNFFLHIDAFTLELSQQQQKTMNDTGGGFYRFPCLYSKTKSCPNFVWQNGDACGTCLVRKSTQDVQQKQISNEYASLWECDRAGSKVCSNNGIGLSPPTTYNNVVRNF